jgi:2-haloacid dehalogenase
VTSRALESALAAIGVSLPDGQARRLVELYDHLPPFPDAVPALERLADSGHELTVLSNGSPAMIENCLGNSGLGDFFGQRISADEVRVFKPSPAVYWHAAERLARPIARIRLVTCNAFDSVGASAAGMRTACVNRSAAPFDTIGRPPDLTVPALADRALGPYAGRRRARRPGCPASPGDQRGLACEVSRHCGLLNG